MSALSNYLEAALLNLTLRNTPFTAPANVYLALFTSNPTDAAGGTEVSGGSYARQAVATSSGFTAPATNGSATQVTNANTVTWPAATANWGSVTHFGIFDASSGGNLLYHGALTTPKTVASGDTFRFLANALAINLD
jgi:hypothetical protein